MNSQTAEVSNITINVQKVYTKKIPNAPHLIRPVPIVPNNPVPIIPPIEINCTCLPSNLLWTPPKFESFLAIMLSELFDTGGV